MVGASLKQLLENDHLLVGISELSEIVGVSPRQLRYWEQKGFIQSVTADANCSRKYRLPTVVKVEIIKKFLDEGYTLTKAAEKAQERLNKMSHVRKVFSKSIKDIQLIDERYTLLLIGDFNDMEQLCIIHDEETDELSYKIFPADETIDPKKVLEK
ncbi:MerR family transcriptional regulator [Enterococcus mundtii]|uniref:MerR family transcriptional regulator n=1 Tax=Enterococcus mundtii TaxID=53346 RepID=A0A1I4NBS6_ENTMU|nr:MerR family transcriptional regulator [Enterococcus mundtii]OTP25589.1 MerR family transcriptional regulator [Enterococcus mundtii]SFM12836.1 MerR HTH family regulatory protein [Enterococcus mundtii]STD21884.1 MerR family transcriptional regulator [Enterococcus mundtii]